MKSYFLDYEKTVQVVKTTCFTQYQFSYLNPKGVDSSCKIDVFFIYIKTKMGLIFESHAPNFEN